MKPETETVKYRVQLELTIETEEDMAWLTERIHRVVAGMRYGSEDYRSPEFQSVEVEQMTVKRLETAGNEQVKRR